MKEYIKWKKENMNLLTEYHESLRNEVDCDFETFAGSYTRTAPAEVLMVAVMMKNGQSISS